MGGTESLVMRSLLTWAWFRPTDEQWEAGARWFRCDVVGGGEQSETLVELPETAEGLLLGQPDDKWMVCADGETVAGSVKLACDQPHTWRAVTTIVLGQPKDPYPGQRLVEVKTRDFCSESVGAWLNYPLEYDYGYTWFHEPEWNAGNRRSICWAKTDRVSARTALAATLAAFVLVGCTPGDDPAGPDGARADHLHDRVPTGTASASTTATDPPAEVPAPPAPSGGLVLPAHAASGGHDRRATAPPIPCSKRHTARTIHVGSLDLVVDGHALAVDSARAQSQLRETCPA